MSLYRLLTICQWLYPFKLSYPRFQNPKLVCWISMGILTSKNINSFMYNTSIDLFKFVGPFKKSKFKSKMFRMKNNSACVIRYRTRSTRTYRTLNPSKILYSKCIYLISFLSLVIISSMHNCMFSNIETDMISSLMNQTMSIDLTPY